MITKGLIMQGMMEQKNEINDLKTRLARSEAIINSSLIVDEITNNGTDAQKEYIKERYEQNKAETLKYRRER